MLSKDVLLRGSLFGLIYCSFPFLLELIAINGTHVNQIVYRKSTAVRFHNKQFIFPELLVLNSSASEHIARFSSTFFTRISIIIVVGNLFRKNIYR